jgi:hypothetical protein
MLLYTLLFALTADPPLEPSPGSQVEVELKVGEVTLTFSGRLVPCTRGRRCVQLPGGRRLTGTLQGDRFVAEAPR